MNEKQKVNADKGSLPPKTKLAVKLIITTGIIGVGLAFLGPFFTSFECSTCGGVSYLDICLCLLYILPAILIHTKNRIAWIFAIVILSGYLAYALIYLFRTIIADAKDSYLSLINIPSSIIFPLVMLIPLILIIRDRKNYFEMLRQRKSDKELQL